MYTFSTPTKADVSLANGNGCLGKRIGVHATASGRRKYDSKGKNHVVAGRPRTNFVNNAERIEKHHILFQHGKETKYVKSGNMVTTFSRLCSN